MRRIPRGFTIIELLVVVSVIGILATITLIGFNRYQADSRDSQRVSKATIISEALEKYYDKNGEYPSCSALTDTGANVTANVLVGTDPKVLLAPQATSDLTNSISLCAALETNNPTDSFAYVGDGSTTCLTGNSCLSYTLQYKEEGTNTIKSIASRRTVNILTSGNIADLSASTFSFSRIDLSWTGISGASSYNIQWKLNSSNFTTPTGTSTSTSTTASVNSLAVNSLYYFRVQPVSSTGSVGNWSNTTSATTYSLDTPVCTASMGSNPMTQLQCSWNSVANATSYTLNYADNPSFTGATNVASATSPYVVSGLTAGTTRYFRVKSVASGYTSGWSATASAVTQLPAPVCNTSTKTTNTQITVSWSASAGAVTYSLDSATNSGFTSPNSITNISGTSKLVTGLNNGTTYYFRVKAINGSVVSTWGACPSAATGVDGPITASWSGRGAAVRNYAGLSWMPGQDPGYGSTWWTTGMYITGTCAPGATVMTRLYSYYAYSNDTSANDASLMDWTSGTQDRYMLDGNDSWYGWYQGWVACQVGGTRAGDTYLGKAGPY